MLHSPDLALGGLLDRNNWTTLEERREGGRQTRCVTSLDCITSLMTNPRLTTFKPWRVLSLLLTHSLSQAALGSIPPSFLLRAAIRVIHVFVILWLSVGELYRLYEYWVAGWKGSKDPANQESFSRSRTPGLQIRLSKVCSNMNESLYSL